MFLLVQRLIDLVIAEGVIIILLLTHLITARLKLHLMLTPEVIHIFITHQLLHATHDIPPAEAFLRNKRQKYTIPQIHLQDTITQICLQEVGNTVLPVQVQPQGAYGLMGWGLGQWEEPFQESV
jgi:hypothetical protein